MSAHQFIQTTMQLAQLDQLARLNAHFHAQREATSLHANLSQALFEMERMAKRVALTLPQDPFAAAMLSHDWLKLVEGIHPTHFVSFEHKRAWADSYETLTSAYLRAQRDPKVVSLLDTYLQQRERLNELLLLLDGDPETPLAAAQQQVDLAVQTKKYHQTAQGYGIAGTGVLFLLWASSNAAGPELSPLLATLLVAVGIYTIKKTLDLRTVAQGIRLAQDRYVAACKLVETYTSFMQDPQTGGFLQRTWEAHPLLFNAPIPMAPTLGSPEPHPSGASVQTFVERQIVERQIVVTRCRFCQQMTPVDGMSCQNCGAPGFGG